MLHALALRHGLHVVEDAAHALPTTSYGRLVGTLPSKATVFSFYANKTITTGEGGMLVTADADLARRARVMRLHGMNRDAFDRFTAKVPSWYYEIVAPGYKYNLTDIAAALGLHQLRRAREFADKRAQMAARYDEAFADLPLLLPPKPRDGDEHPWHLYVVRLTDDAPLSRDAFIEGLFQAGIGCSVHYIPLHLHPYWRDRYRLQPGQFPHSQRAFERMVSLPLYTRMSGADMDRVIQAVQRLLRP
jgi:dTDP-4-amino-4,6-dideoxygalactose transaminase